MRESLCRAAAVALLVVTVLPQSARADDAAAQLPSPLAPLHHAIASSDWTAITPGVDRLSTTAAPAHVLALTAYRLAPTSIRMRVVPQLAPGGSSAVDIAASSHAAIVINAGFFWITPDNALAPTGLLISDGKTLAPRKDCRACPGVIYADKKGVHIERERNLKSVRGITAAVQVGPMLVEKGAVITFKPEGPAAARSAVCLDAAHNVIVVAALSALTLYEMAALMQAAPKDGGFGCDTALNLDGGPSTQVAVTIKGHSEQLGFPRPVQNFLAFELK